MNIFCFVFSGFYFHFTWFRNQIFADRIIVIAIFRTLTHIYFFQDSGVIYFSDLKIKTAECKKPRRHPYCKFCFLNFCKRNIFFPSECIMAISSELREVNIKYLKKMIYTSFLMVTVYSGKSLVYISLKVKPQKSMCHHQVNEIIRRNTTDI